MSGVVKGFLRVLILASALGASPAQGQTDASGSTPPEAQEHDATQTQRAADTPWAGLVFGATIEILYQEDVMLLALGLVLLGVATFVALVAFVELCDRVQVVMTILCLVLSVVAFAYLVYAMLRPEQF